MFLLINVLTNNHRSTNTISIHLMFLLIDYPTVERYIAGHFNTSHVSINQKNCDV